MWGTVFDQDALQIASTIMRPKGWDAPSVLSFLPSVPPAIIGETPLEELEGSSYLRMTMIQVWILTSHSNLNEPPVIQECWFKAAGPRER